MMRVIAVLCWLLVPFAVASARAEPVDLELVLSVDSSGSIDGGEFRLQREGYARALTHPDVIDAIRRGPYGAVAITFVEWSGPAIHNQVVGWTKLSGEADAARVAEMLLSAPRTIFGGGTSIGGAILMAAQLMEDNGFEGTRRVIDISGDGPNNRGPLVAEPRAAAIARGITINGLPILEFDDSLERYFREFVIGGPGAFVQPANGFADFARAVRKKLIQELNLSRVAPAVAGPRPVSATGAETPPAQR